MTNKDNASTVCDKCGGAGFYYLLPEGMNAFKMRYPQLANAMVRHECVYCDARNRLGPTEADKECWADENAQKVKEAVELKTRRPK